jgi:RNA polymerase sigma-70 factor (ECF subfamily)
MSASGERRIEELLRELAPQVLGVLARRYAQFDAAEDAIQEALLAAALQWPADGVPDNPRSWLLTVAGRRIVDEFRSESARRSREETVLRLDVAPDAVDRDDTLTLLFLCCHPSVSPPSQLALTLRAVGGLSTAEIGRAFLVPEATMAQRISRAKAKIKSSGLPFEMPPADERAERLKVVRQVLYLVFNEGYTASAGDDLVRGELCADAIRLTRELAGLMPDEPEVAGLLGLLLLTESRRAARTAADGSLVLLPDQDRSRWDRALIAEGQAIVRACLRRNRPGPYQIQAAIAAVHSDAPTAADTDWSQVVALYDQLTAVAPTPVVALNRAVAVAELQGPAAGLEALEALELPTYHLFHAARADLLARLDRPAEAAQAYERALELATNATERAFLAGRLAGTTR